MPNEQKGVDNGDETADDCLPACLPACLAEYSFAAACSSFGIGTEYINNDRYTHG